MRHFVFSDIHGRMDLFVNIKKFLNELNEEYVVFFLGDAIDRGPRGWDIMNELLSDPEHFIYLKGNHEQMFLEACEEYLQEAIDEGYSAHPADWARSWSMSSLPYLMTQGHAMDLYYANGGEPTFESWIRCGCPIQILKNIRKMIVQTQYIDDKHNLCYDFCHAGCFIEDWSDQTIFGQNEKLWSRNHFSQKWEIKDKYNHILIHGHTPLCFMKNPRPKKITIPFVYAQDSKVCIDTGCFNTGVINLIDLDDQKAYQFYA